MTITNLPTYSQQQYLSSQHHYHHLNPTAAGHPHHSHVHPAHPHIHHSQHPYTAHPHAGLTHTQHVLAGPIRTEPVTRKRPKYTRSKTGCLTCRVKKIKCDETKPTCTRCSHGQRECTWPENVPTRKKPVPKKGSEQSEERSPALSPAETGQSTASTSTARDESPARRSPLENLVSTGSAVSSRRNTSEPNTAAGSPIVSPVDPPPPLSRRPSLQTGSSVSYSSNPQQLRAQYSHSITPPTVSPVSFHPSPSSPHDYQSYNGSPASNGHNGHSGGLTRHDLPAIQTSQTRLSGLAVDSSNNMNSWQTSSMLQADSLEPSFYRHLQERNLVGRSSTSYAS